MTMDLPESMFRSSVVTGAAINTGTGGLGEKGCGCEHKREI
jgi:hypothetical protein